MIMADTDQQKWDARYARQSQREAPAPARWLVDTLPRLPPGTALDLACGRGGNAIYLASQGYSVDAVDVSPVGLELAREAARKAGVRVHCVCQDLLADIDISGWCYDLIVMYHFIAPDLLARLSQALRTGGVLMVEQHMTGFPGAAGPGSDRFRVAPGELAAAVTGLEILQIEEGLLPPESAPEALLLPLDQWFGNDEPNPPAPFALSRLLARRAS